MPTANKSKVLSVIFEIPTNVVSLFPKSSVGVKSQYSCDDAPEALSGVALKQPNE